MERFLGFVKELFERFIVWSLTPVSTTSDVSIPPGYEDSSIYPLLSPGGYHAHNNDTEQVTDPGIA